MPIEVLVLRLGFRFRYRVGNEEAIEMPLNSHEESDRTKVLHEFTLDKFLYNF